MAFYFLFYTVFALLDVAPPLTRALFAIGGVYGLAFFSLVAGYFWARWYAVGVGLFGVITAALGIWQTINDPQNPSLTPLIFFGGTHLAATLLLWGDAMSKPYDGQTAWRERYHMDDHAVQRLGRSVVRAGLSLPLVLLYAFQPRESFSMLALVAFVAGAAGFAGLIRLKTWGVITLGAAGVLTLALVSTDIAAVGISARGMQSSIAGILLVAAAIPFIAPMVQFLRTPRLRFGRGGV